MMANLEIKSNVTFNNIWLLDRKEPFLKEDYSLITYFKNYRGNF